jgi:hypothetical protein
MMPQLGTWLRNICRILKYALGSKENLLRAFYRCNRQEVTRSTLRGLLICCIRKALDAQVITMR